MILRKYTKQTNFKLGVLYLLNSIANCLKWMWYQLLEQSGILVNGIPKVEKD